MLNNELMLYCCCIDNHPPRFTTAFPMGAMIAGATYLPDDRRKHLIGENFILDNSDDNISCLNPWFGVPIVCEQPNVKHALQRHLEQNGIQTRNYFAGNLLLHPGYKHLGDAKEFPNAYQVLNRVFFVGCHPGMTDDAFEWIEEVIAGFLKGCDIVADGYNWGIADLL